MAAVVLGLIVAVALGVLLFFWYSADVSDSGSGWSSYPTPAVVTIEASPVSVTPRFVPTTPTP
jgi:hypothetical protein